MPRGVAHPDDFRAEVIAAVRAGAQPAAVARQFGLSKSLVSEWVKADRTPLSVRTEIRTEQREALALKREEVEYALALRILHTVRRNLETIDAQLQTAARPAWVEKQSAAELAELVAVERDTVIRLLGGIAHRPEPPDDSIVVLDAAQASESADG